MTLADLAWWSDACEQLSELHKRHGSEAEDRAVGYGQCYAGRRPAMVFDVVASRQRRYLQRVQPLVQRFEATNPAATLASLAADGPGDGYGLRRGEGQTMQSVAAGLVRFLEDKGLAEEAGLALWATQASVFEHAAKLEPYVGAVGGMGPALLAYLRMRCGADAIKPDVRVRGALNRLGFQVPSDEHAILVVARGAADDLGIPLLVLDQLLWWATDEPGT